MLPSSFITDLHALLRHNDTREVAQAIADAFEAIARRRVLMLTAPGDVVFTDSELEALERKVQGAWLSARYAYEAIRKERPDHSTVIKFGRQLSERYRKQKKVGPHRLYWIEAPLAIDTPKA